MTTSEFLKATGAMTPDEMIRMIEWLATRLNSVNREQAVEASVWHCEACGMEDDYCDC